MQKAKMSLLDVCCDLRSRGMSITQKTLSDGIVSGVFSFGKLLAENPSGRRTFLILRNDYLSWADKNIGPVHTSS